MPTLHIVRGLPGSGKSTFAKKLAAELHCKHFEADMFFTDKEGNYKFDLDRIGDAHEWCHDSVLNELRNGNDVVVSNTFTTPRELRAYDEDVISVATFLKPVEYQIIIYEMTGDYGNIHNVPEEALERMKKRWISNAELDALITCGEIRWFHNVEFRSITS